MTATSTQHETDAPASAATTISTTKVALPQSWLFTLASNCADLVHAAVVSQHLKLLEGRHRPDSYICESIQEMRAIVRSIEDPWERRDFTRTVRFLFLRLREAKGTQVRGRDYVAKVRAFEASQGRRVAA